MTTVKCPECEKRQMTPAITELVGTTHGESVPIISDALVCSNCGFKTVPSGKMGEFALRVADAYRVRHGLLTSSQIKERRLDLGMSQQQFASYLGVGSSSVKRWELGYIQDKAMNDLMLLKTDVRKAEANVEEVLSRLGGSPEITWGGVFSQALGNCPMNAFWEPQDSPGVYRTSPWTCRDFALFAQPGVSFGNDADECDVDSLRELVA